MRRIVISPGEYYHLYSRGVDKRVIFDDDSDKKRFKIMMFLCNQEKKVSFKTVDTQNPFDLSKKEENIISIGAWCLMDNHFHILAKETKSGGISSFMQKLMTGYTMYYNKKRQRNGALFGSTYRAEHLETDNHLKRMFSYIHLNPLSLRYPEWKKGVLDIGEAAPFLFSYSHSSFLDYATENGRQESCIINKENFPEYFDGFDGMLRDHLEWIEIQNEIAKASVGKHCLI